MSRWEYKILEENFKMSNTRLNAMGQEGWELVSVITRHALEAWEFDYVFKRETKHVPGRR